ncbi:NUDIX domain-containing protein [Streptomyces pluripotens]|uniref:NUDIX domain-containing protein n=1 Tax=Streptomyces pluripotens TaxID=1355015 RepID=A0A221P141_9ACTN|nr:MULTISPECIES: NUDIX domain-containing protein [Streptomyces]ARP71545.1 DNA mismatch repair protein MutT [Streptomyces pluripotens]ASN25796.1 NUDIX domain-containing protein [Streptomyces pluripotens]KIE25102.1 DNA mismatch repair protein MutT [Streptomyces sp. MUSC 125]
MILQPLSAPQEVPARLLSELTALYASNSELHGLGNGFPNPDGIRPEQVAKVLPDELAVPDSEVLLARTEDGRLVGLSVTLAHHPDPADPDPWIGLLMVHAAEHGEHGKEYGRTFAELVENRFRTRGRTAIRLAVLDDDPEGLSFWNALGYAVIGHDQALGLPRTVLRKSLRTPRRAARIAVVAPDGAVLLFRYDNVEVGVHWALPGGGLEPGEGPREGARRELAEETGWTDLEPGPLLHTWEHDFTHSGIPVRQHERIYVSRGPRRDPAGPHLAAAHAADAILTWRWWSRRELAEEAEPVWPPGLARLLDEWED